MNPQGPIYFWPMRCERNCTFVKTSPDVAGNPAWLSEVCPVQGCGAKVFCLDLPGPDEKVPGK